MDEVGNPDSGSANVPLRERENLRETVSPKATWVMPWRPSRALSLLNECMNAMHNVPRIKREQRKVFIIIGSLRVVWPEKRKMEVVKEVGGPVFKRALETMQCRCNVTTCMCKSTSYISHLHRKPFMKAPGTMSSSSVSGTQRQRCGLGPLIFPNSCKYSPRTFPQGKWLVQGKRKTL